MSLLGKILRAPLGLVANSQVLPILTGPARGMRWIAGAGTHGCWIGSYERAKAFGFAGLMQPGASVYDIGANVGYYTLLAAHGVGPAGRVFAFEPLPRNLDYLQQHVRLNALANVTIVPRAISDTVGSAQFAVAGSALMGHLSVDGSLAVESTTIDHFVAAGHPAPQVMKVDVEGAEIGVLRGAEQTIRRHQPIVVLAGHSTAIQRECEALLDSFGYLVTVDPATGHDGQFESIARPRSHPTKFGKSDGY